MTQNSQREESKYSSCSIWSMHITDALKNARQDGLINLRIDNQVELFEPVITEMLFNAPVTNNRAWVNFPTLLKRLKRNGVKIEHVDLIGALLDAGIVSDRLLSIGGDIYAAIDAPDKYYKAGANGCSTTEIYEDYLNNMNILTGSSEEDICVIKRWKIIQREGLERQTI